MAEVVGVRLPELLGVLARAGDLGMGRPMGSGLRTCVLAHRLARVCELAADDVSDVYWLALLEHAGCTVGLGTMASVFGDEIATRSWLSRVDKANAAQVLGGLWERAGGIGAFARTLFGVSRVIANNEAVCDVAVQVARRVRLPERVHGLLACVHERFDGRGSPRGLRGDAVPLPVRVVHVAEDIALWGADADGALRAHAGRALDPTIVAAARGSLAALQAEPATGTWDEVLALEPGARSSLHDDHLDAVLTAIADVADLMSPWFVDHSRSVADVTAGALVALGAPAAEVQVGRRAGWLHDAGRLGISVRVWDKAGPLDDGEREQVRLHAYQTERLLDRVTGLADVARAAGAAHERREGSGYPHGGPPPSRVAAALAVADVWCALRSARPHRAALDEDAAIRALRALPLDPDAVRATLESVGQRPTARTAAPWPDGLTDREVDVVRLAARGLTNKEIATTLEISTKTAGNHLQNAFPKMRVTTRAAATLYAMQHGLLRDR